VIEFADFASGPFDMPDQPRLPLLQIIVASTRDQRQGRAVGDWLADRVRAHAKFVSELIDLREVGLPLLDEPKHPRFRQYQHDHTKGWSATVDRADAYVFVTPEYNYSAPPALINALDYLHQEWAYKPAAFVSYGGVSGGTRSVQMSKQVVTTLRMMPIPEAVSVPFFMKFIRADTGAFAPDAPIEQSATVMLDELLRWTGALAVLRVKP
jgi:NAD(P)H-dependent FMN reductase